MVNIRYVVLRRHDGTAFIEDSTFMTEQAAIEHIDSKGKPLNDYYLVKKLIKVWD